MPGGRQELNAVIVVVCIVAAAPFGFVAESWFAFWAITVFFVGASWKAGLIRLDPPC